MIYLLEDDNNIRNFVTYALNNSGLETQGFEKPSEFWRAMEEKKPQMAILDIMLPEEDGLSVLRKLRKSSETYNLPIMMLTAKSTEYDKVVGLDGGADDYMTKPFNVLELKARVKALLKRAGLGVAKEKKEEITVGGLTLDQRQHVVHRGEEIVDLTAKEYDLLELLMRNCGLVLTKENLLVKIWGYESDAEDNNLEVYISFLRRKLGHLHSAVKIRTIRMVGYCLEVEE